MHCSLIFKLPPRLNILLNRTLYGGFYPIDDTDRIPIRKLIKCPHYCLCSLNITVDYKNVELLSQFTSHVTGAIYSRFSTGICGDKQNEITIAIKRAKYAGLMPYTYKLATYINKTHFKAPISDVTPTTTTTSTE